MGYWVPRVVIVVWVPRVGMGTQSGYGYPEWTPTHILKFKK